MPPATSVVVLLPGLLEPLLRRRAAGAPCPQPPGLIGLVARSEVRRPAPEPFEQAALRLAGLETVGETPAGALRRLGLGQPADDSGWMAADPVHIRPDLNGSVLFEGPELTLTREEAEALCAAFNHHWRAEGLSLEITAPEHWHLRLPPHAPGVITTGLRAVRGRDPFTGLPAGPGRRFWWRVLNETQMLLHGHPVNETRAARGLPRVNGLWLWGAGPLPAPPAAPVTVFSGDPFVRGLGLAHRRGDAQPLPVDPHRAWSGPGTRLVHLDALARAADYDDPAAWEAGLEALDAGWLRPLAEELASGRLRRVCLVDPAGLELHPRPGRWRGLLGRRGWLQRVAGAGP